MINKGGVIQERGDWGGLEDWNPFFFSTSDEREMRDSMRWSFTLALAFSRRVVRLSQHSVLIVLARARRKIAIGLSADGDQISGWRWPA